MSAANFINFFIDPKARVGVDGFLTINYGDYADPAALLSTLILPEGSQNYDQFNDPAMIAALEDARSTADPNKRAALVADVEKHRHRPAVDPDRPADVRADDQQEAHRGHGHRSRTCSRPGPTSWAGPASGGADALRFLAAPAGDARVSLLVASFVIFAAIYLAPGNPIAALVRRPFDATGEPRRCSSTATTSTSRSWSSTGTG